MITVQELLNQTRVLDDVTMAMLIQDALEDLFASGRLGRDATLGDNIIELIVSNLRNAIGTGGMASHFAVMNMLASPSVKIGSIDPIKSATVFLQKFKSGEDSEPFPALLDPNDQGETTFSSSFELIEINGAKVIKIPYQTTEYSITGGSILITTKTLPAGILCFVVAPGFSQFESPSEEGLAKIVESGGGARFPASEKIEEVTELLQAALASLQSGNPQFSVPNVSACSPIPNFRRSENWPKIEKIIQDWLDAHA
jgi:hypothetical protein